MPQKNNKLPINSSDIILVAVAIYLAIKTPWNDLKHNGFFVIFLALFCFCIFLKVMKFISYKRDLKIKMQRISKISNTKAINNTNKTQNIENDENTDN